MVRAMGASFEATNDSGIGAFTSDVNFTSFVT